MLLGARLANVPPMKGAELTPWLVRHGYEQGIFPMGDAETGIVDWFLPHYRCLLPVEGLHVSRSLAKTIRRGGYEVTFDRAFHEVMLACRRPADEGNWIDEHIVRVFDEIHRMGWGHSCEVWSSDGELVGGTYGVAIGGAFCAESMFHRRTDMSKVALVSMVEMLRKLDFRLIDAQFMTPHLATLGAYEVSNASYQVLLRGARDKWTIWDSLWRPSEVNDPIANWVGV